MRTDVKELLETIRDLAWRESPLAYPHPEWHVPMEPLLDKLSEIFRISKDEIGRIVNQ